MPNARRQAPPRAGATKERRLLAVACKPLFGPAAPLTPGLPGPRWPRGAPACGTPRGTRAAPTPAPVGDTPHRVALADTAASAPCACERRGRRACSGVKQSARGPRPCARWETHAGRRRTVSRASHPLRTRAGHLRRAPGSAHRAGRGPAARDRRRRLDGEKAGRLRGASPADASRRRWDHPHTGPRRDRHAWAVAPCHPSCGRGMRDRAAPARQIPALVSCSPHARGVEPAAQGATARDGRAKA